MEFWYGLQAAIHCLTQRGQWEMRVDYQKNDKTWSYLHYNQFSVGSASEEYPLTVGGFIGVGTDWLNDKSYPHNGISSLLLIMIMTSTVVVTVQLFIRADAWWYHGACYHININRQPPEVSSNALFSEMKICPKDCITQ